MSLNDQNDDDMYPSQREQIEKFSDEFSAILRKNMNELQQRVLDEFHRYEQIVKNLKIELKETQTELIQQECQHDIERRQWKQEMDKLKERKQ